MMSSGLPEISFIHPLSPQDPPPEALALGLDPQGNSVAPLLPGHAGVLRQVCQRLRRFDGESGSTEILWRDDGLWLLTGLGSAEARTAEDWREIGGHLFAAAAGAGPEQLTVRLTHDPEQAAALAFGLALRAWRGDTDFRQQDSDDPWYLQTVLIESSDPEQSAACFVPLLALARGVHWARDLSHAPANRLTPRDFAAALERLTEQGIGVTLLPATRETFPLVMAVGQGSAEQPLVAVLSWTGAQTDSPPVPPLALVGKGVCFDAGGLALKPADDMDEMKGDMAGAAAIAGLFAALPALRPSCPVVAVLPLVENMPSGTAMRGGDVVRSRAGLSVEILDPDAEGRLILADALHYAAEQFAPAALVDLATLTGAVEVALGRQRAGLFCNTGGLADALFQAGEQQGERLWRLPLTDLYDDDLRSDCADLRNCSWAKRAPDALHAARFLEHFVPPGLPWAHLDIAGMTLAEEDGPLGPEGATGYGVRLLWEWIRMQESARRQRIGDNLR